MLYGIQDISVLLFFLHRPPEHPEPGWSGNLPCEKLFLSAMQRVGYHLHQTRVHIYTPETILCEQSWELFTKISDDAIGIDGLSSSRNDRCTGRYRQWQRRTFSFILSYNWLNFSRSTYSPQSVGTCISDDRGRRNRSSMIWKKNNWARLTITTLTLVLLEPYRGL